ncbi:MAG: S8 family serine peptidase [Promethearchaeota archaeon]
MKLLLSSADSFHEGGCVDYMKVNSRNKNILILLSVLLVSTYFSSGASGLDMAIPDIGMDLVWNSTSNYGDGQIIGIVDTGVEWRHPDFYRTRIMNSLPQGPFFNPTDVTNTTMLCIDMNENGLFDTGEGPVKVYDVGVINNSNILYGSDGDFNGDIDFLYIDEDQNGEWNQSVEPLFFTDGDVGPMFPGGPVNQVLFNESKILEIWDQGTNNLYVNGVNLTNSLINTHVDSDGHGTHVAGIAAGGEVFKRRYVGAAPNSDLMIVKVNGWSDQNVADGIDWLVANGVDVISLSFGLFFKNLTLDGAGIDEGGSLSEAAIERAWGDGVPVVTSAGNVGDKDAHATVSLNTGESTQDLVIVPSEPNIYQLAVTFLWRTPNNNMSFGIRDPIGNFIGPIDDSTTAIGQWHTIPVSGGFYHYYVSYMPVNSRGTSKAYVYIISNNNISVDDHTITTPLASGTWLVDLNNSLNGSQVVEEYVFSSDSDTGGFWGRPGAFFQNSNPAMTVTAPSTADHAIVVGSHITTGAGSIGNISAFSSRGVRIDGYQYKMITAPGESLTSAKSRNSGGTGNYTTKMGTSMATPLVAGSIAVAFQNNNALKTNLTRLVEDLMSSANVDSFVTSWGAAPNNVFGYGKLNASAFVIQSGLYNPTWMPSTPVLTTNATNPDTNGIYSLNWTAPGADSVTLYEYAFPILVENGSLTVVASGLTNSSYIMNHAVNGSWYYAVVSINGSGRALSNTLQVNVSIPPGTEYPPADVVLTINATNPDIDGIYSLNWTATGADNFTLYEYSSNITAENGSLTTIATGLTNNSYIMSKASNGTWWYAVVAVNASGRTLSNSLDVNVHLEIPGQFNLSTTDAGNPDTDGIFYLNWTRPTRVDNMTIYMYTSPITEINGSLGVIPVGIGEYSHQMNITVDGTYYFVVVARNTVGDRMSNCVSVTVSIPNNQNQVPGYSAWLIISLLGVSVIFTIKRRVTRSMS